MPALEAHVRSSKSPQVAHRRQIQLAQYAWRNRRAPTESEARLWEALRGGKLGVQFRRQMPIDGRYIVDFVATVPRLVVEVDGAYHASRTRADARRDRELARLGYRVVRLPAVLVTRHLTEAVELVASALRNR